MTSGVKSDLTGKVFGRLTVTVEAAGRSTPNGSKRAFWTCKCSCGNTLEVWSAALLKGTTKSCGCLAKELSSKRNKTHGSTASPEYQTWRGMKERCDNPENSHYLLYGGRGIGYCERWAKFENFLSDMGRRPKGRTLDRVDNNLGYSPDNCRWATADEQSRNTSRNVNITWNGETKCLKDWATTLGITGIALAYRLRNWSMQRAMTEASTNSMNLRATFKDRNQYENR
jgi:hypothetical protein